jgi:L-ascorbate metabolism protein UlaG (beta-lactamase superfamily)
MKSPVHILLSALVISSLAGAQQPDKQPLTVTYVGNEGFLIECGGKKILVDALFGGWEADWCQVPPDSVVELMKAARPPFDNVDLIAVTHAHVDHFDADIVAAHMKNNPRGILVCSEQARQKLDSAGHITDIGDRIRVVPPSGDSSIAMQIAGIGLTAFPIPHGAYWETDEKTGEKVNRHRNVQHLGFLFTVGGRTLFHGGDSPLNDFELYRLSGLDRARIDVAFVEWWCAWNAGGVQQKVVREVIRPDRIIVMHLAPGKELPLQRQEQKPLAREIIVPRQPLEKWTIR